MKKNLLSLFILFSLVLAACAPAATPTPVAPTEAPAAAPTTRGVAPTEAPTAEPTAEPTLEPTLAPTSEPTAAAPAGGTVKAVQLPDLNGQKVVAVTGNDYTPLNFVDPKSGEASRLGIRCGERDLPAAELPGGLAGIVVGHDDRGGERRTVRRGDGRDHHHGRAEERSGLFDAVHGIAAVHAGASGREPLQHAGGVRCRPEAVDRLADGDDQLLRGGVRTCWTGTKPTRASSCSRTLGRRCRR